MSWWSWRSFAAGAGIAVAGFAALIIAGAAAYEPPDPEPYVLERDGEPMDVDAALAAFEARAERIAELEDALAALDAELTRQERRAERAEARVAELELSLVGVVPESCVVTWQETGECGSLDELIERYNAAVAGEPDRWSQWLACLEAWEDPATGDMWPACSPIIPDLRLLLAALLAL